MDIDIVTRGSLYHDVYYQVPQVMTKDLLLLASRLWWILPFPKDCNQSFFSIISLVVTGIVLYM